MRPVPRILPIIAVTIGGVLAINALSGVRDLPQLMSGAKAFAQGVKTPKPDAAKGAPATGAAATPKPGEKPAVPTDAGKLAQAATTPAEAGEMQMAANTTNSPYSGSILAASKSGALAAPATKSVAKSAAICAPTAAELAKAAGMSPTRARPEGPITAPANMNPATAGNRKKPTNKAAMTATPRINTKSGRASMGVTARSLPAPHRGGCGTSRGGP